VPKLEHIPEHDLELAHPVREPWQREAKQHGASTQPKESYPGGLEDTSVLTMYSHHVARCMREEDLRIVQLICIWFQIILFNYLFKNKFNCILVYCICFFSFTFMLNYSFFLVICSIFNYICFNIYFNLSFYCFYNSVYL